jgi:hypothetical protein
MFQETSSTSFSTFSVTGTTGGTVQRSGPYKCRSTPQVTVFCKKGSKFPKDAKGKSTTWDLLKTAS